MGLLDSEIGHAIAEKINPFAKILRRRINIKTAAVALLTPEHARL
jgi:hypothetical protein